MLMKKIDWIPYVCFPTGGGGNFIASMIYAGLTGEYMKIHPTLGHVHDKTNHNKFHHAWYIEKFLAKRRHKIGRIMNSGMVILDHQLHFVETPPRYPLEYLAEYLRPVNISFELTDLAQLSMASIMKAHGPSYIYARHDNPRSYGDHVSNKDTTLSTDRLMTQLCQILIKTWELGKINPNDSDLWTKVFTKEIYADWLDVNDSDTEKTFYMNQLNMKTPMHMIKESITAIYNHPFNFENIVDIKYRDILTKPKFILEQISDLANNNFPKDILEYYEQYRSINRDLFARYVPFVDWETGQIK